MRRRAGWQGAIGSSEWKGALWIAYYYWDTENEVTGTVGAEDGTQIQYKVVQGPEVPWNLALGGRIEFRENVTAMFEWGFNEDVLILVAAGTFRF